MTAIVLWLPVSILIGSIIYNHLNSDLYYEPSQPVKFSHKVHSNDYKIKCLFCHHTAEKTLFSAIPTTESCMICHVALRAESKLMIPVIKSYDSKKPIQWLRINKLPEFTKFNHSGHINASIDCSSCHGNIELMDTVYRAKDFTMKWCLDCHREPEKYVILPRDITGIFMSGNNIKELDKKNIIANTIPMSSPQYGEYFTGNLFQKSGIAQSKLPGRGPENCSACHY